MHLCHVLQVGTYDYAGCMTVPRLLHLDHDRLHQSPAPELLSLRRGESWQATHVQLSTAASLTLPGVVGSSRLDIEVCGDSCRRGVGIADAACLLCCSHCW